MSDIKATETPAPREKLEGGQILSCFSDQRIMLTEDQPRSSPPTCTGHKADMTAAQEAMAKFTIEKDIAQHIKRTVRTPPEAVTADHSLTLFSLTSARALPGIASSAGISVASLLTAWEKWLTGGGLWKSLL
ncbi:uncharacterized protein NECHADRAFT_75250 [Fusarium vanettenii 77-13-4]|uniref:Uncharacterized protein n=1 Tax=Fusarium vanettenii (strain ATCC MYA-4622 / CBS 123669 / FGSC 9596 / NRRL 45880 / 77-13-4) TaxID=660122 RepID=C7YIA5_FUSV7|nr:uncharacterized protein NECHADRAFT_75250 [Fusarium vanettenii 77-13-4]EEU48771.1 hypothetical protein NECHADRAFT_75250 [Fusarium vanettenii 77-13-4]